MFKKLKIAIIAFPIDVFPVEFAPNRILTFLYLKSHKIGKECIVKGNYIKLL